MNYAASDAIVALHIMQSLVKLKLSRQDARESLASLSGGNASLLSIKPSSSLTNERSSGLEEWLLKEENLACLMSMCQGILEVPYKQQRRTSEVSLTCELDFTRIE